MPDDYPIEIISEEDFKWIEDPIPSLFIEKEITYKYDAYSIRFEEPNLPNMVRVKRGVYLEILLANVRLLGALLKVEYQLDAREGLNLQLELRRIGLDVHSRFLREFDRRVHQETIFSKFRPVFDHEAAEQRIVSILETGYGF